MSNIWLTPAIGIGMSTSVGASSAQNQQNMQMNDLFASTTPTQDMMDNIAASAISNGMNAQQSGNDTEAIKDYKLSIGLSPYSDNSVKAYQLLAGIYQKQGNTAEAITLFKQAQEVFPQSDTIDCALGAPQLQITLTLFFRLLRPRRTRLTAFRIALFTWTHRLD